jgi:hypothetical protein
LCLRWCWCWCWCWCYSWCRGLFEKSPASSPLLLYCNGIVLGKPVSGVVVMGERICVCWWLWWYSTIGFVIPTRSCGVPLATCTYSVQRLFDIPSETLSLFLLDYSNNIRTTIQNCLNFWGIFCKSRTTIQNCLNFLGTFLRFPLHVSILTFG